MSEAKINITAKDNASRVLAEVQASMARAQRTADMLGTALGFVGVAGVSGLALLAKSTIDGMDALNDLSDATGASIENISALEDVAARTGTTFDTVQTSLVKFNAVLSDAKPGSAAAQSLEALGLSVKNLQALDPAEALRQTAVALGAFADDGNKARVVQELFGKSVKEVAPFLKDLAEQTQLLGTVTTEQAKAAEAFNKELFNLQKNAQDAARSVLGPLVQAINESIARFREGAAAGQSFYDVILNQQLKLLGLKNSSTDYADQLATVNARLQESNPSLTVRNALLREQAELQKKIAARPVFSADDQSAAELARLARKPGLSVPAAPAKTTRAAGSKATSDPDADFKRYLDQLQKQIEKTQELGVYGQLLADIDQKRLTVTPAQQAVLGNLAKQLDSVKAQEEAEKRLAEAIKETSAAQEEFFASVMKSDEAKQNQIANLLGATPTVKFERQLADIDLLKTEFEQGRISEKLYVEAIQARLDLTGESLTKTKSLADELNLSFTSAFEDAIVGGKGLSGVLQGLEKDIIRIVTRKMVTEPLGDAISGAMKGGSGGLAGFFGSLFSFDGGGYTGGGSRAGGLDGKGGFMAMLHPQETVLDHTKGQSAASSVQVVNHFVISGPVDRRTQDQIAARVGGSTQRAISRNA